MANHNEEMKLNSDLSILRNLEIDQEVSFHISKTSNIRSMCSTFGLQWGKRFVTKTSRENSTITVKRTL